MPVGTDYAYDPGILPSSANQCFFGNVYLRSNLARKHRAPEAAYLLGILCGGLASEAAYLGRTSRL